MKNYSQGFIVPFLVIIIALLTVGGGAYYFSQKPKDSQSPTQLNPIPVSSATTTASDKTNCADNNMQCFLAAVQTCSPAVVKWTKPLDFYNAFDQIGQDSLELIGLDSNGNCLFSNQMDTVTKIDFTQKSLEQLGANGYTETSPKVQAVIDLVEKRLVGLRTDCTMSVKSLANVLTRWSGKTTINADLEANGSMCVTTLPDQSKVNLTNSNAYISNLLFIAPSSPSNTAKVESDISSIQIQAEIYYATTGNSSYGTASNGCTTTGSVFASAQIAGLISDMKKAAVNTSVTCNNSKTAYAVQAQISSTAPASYWCVDSKGTKKMSSVHLGKGDSCP